MSDRREQSESRTNIRLQYVALLITVAPFVVALIRVAKVSNLDPSAVALLLQTANITALVAGAAIDLAPIAIVYAALTYFAVRRGLLPNQKRRLEWYGLPILLVLLLIGTAFLTLLHLALFLVLAGLWMVPSLIRRVRKEPRTWAERRTDESADWPIFQRLTAIVLASTLVGSTQMWLPKEMCSRARQSGLPTFLRRTTASRRCLRNQIANSSSCLLAPSLVDSPVARDQIGSTRSRFFQAGNPSFQSAPRSSNLTWHRPQPSSF